jgi:hypothetical protein
VLTGLSGPSAILGGVKNQIPRGLREQASLQAGVVSRQQALKAGLPAGAITWYVKSGRWQQVFAGVYATFTGTIARNARLWAIVLYCGRQARLSHETAAELQGLIDGQFPLVQVTIPRNRQVRPLEGVVIRRSAHMSRPWQPLGIPPHTFVDETIIRYGWSDVTRWACETARQEADALRHRGWTGELKPCSPGCRAVTGSDQERPSRCSA